MYQPGPEINRTGRGRDFISGPGDHNGKREWCKYRQVLDGIHMGPVGAMRPCLLERIVTGERIGKNRPADPAYPDIRIGHYDQRR